MMSCSAYISLWKCLVCWSPASGIQGNMRKKTRAREYQNDSEGHRNNPCPLLVNQGVRAGEELEKKYKVVDAFYRDSQGDKKSNTAKAFQT